MSAESKIMNMDFDALVKQRQHIETIIHHYADPEGPYHLSCAQALQFFLKYHDRNKLLYTMDLVDQLCFENKTIHEKAFTHALKQEPNIVLNRNVTKTLLHYRKQSSDNTQSTRESTTRKNNNTGHKDDIFLPTDQQLEDLMTLLSKSRTAHPTVLSVLALLTHNDFEFYRSLSQREDDNDNNNTKTTIHKTNVWIQYVFRYGLLLSHNRSLLQKIYPNLFDPNTTCRDQSSTLDNLYADCVLNLYTLVIPPLQHSNNDDDGQHSDTITSQWITNNQTYLFTGHNRRSAVDIILKREKEKHFIHSHSPIYSQFLSVYLLRKSIKRGSMHALLLLSELNQCAASKEWVREREINHNNRTDFMCYHNGIIVCNYKHGHDKTTTSSPYTPHFAYLPTLLKSRIVLCDGVDHVMQRTSEWIAYTHSHRLFRHYFDFKMELAHTVVSEAHEQMKQYCKTHSENDTHSEQDVSSLNQILNAANTFFYQTVQELSDINRDMLQYWKQQHTTAAAAAPHSNGIQNSSKLLEPVLYRVILSILSVNRHLFHFEDTYRRYWHHVDPRTLFDLPDLFVEGRANNISFLMDFNIDTLHTVLFSLLSRHTIILCASNTTTVQQSKKDTSSSQSNSVLRDLILQHTNTQSTNQNDHTSNAVTSSITTTRKTWKCIHAENISKTQNDSKVMLDHNHISTPWDNVLDALSNYKDTHTIIRDHNTNKDNDTTSALLMMWIQQQQEQKHTHRHYCNLNYKNRSEPRELHYTDIVGDIFQLVSPRKTLKYIWQFLIHNVQSGCCYTPIILALIHSDPKNGQLYDLERSIHYCRLQLDILDTLDRGMMNIGRSHCRWLKSPRLTLKPIVSNRMYQSVNVLLSRPNVWARENTNRGHPYWMDFMRFNPDFDTYYWIRFEDMRPLAMHLLTQHYLNPAFLHRDRKPLLYHHRIESLPNHDNPNVDDTMDAPYTFELPIYTVPKRITTLMCLLAQYPQFEQCKRHLFLLLSQGYYNRGHLYALSTMTHALFQYERQNTDISSLTRVIHYCYHTQQMSQSWVDQHKTTTTTMKEMTRYLNEKHVSHPSPHDTLYDDGDIDVNDKNNNNNNNNIDTHHDLVRDTVDAHALFSEKKTISSSSSEEHCENPMVLLGVPKYYHVPGTTYLDTIPNEVQITKETLLNDTHIRTWDTLMCDFDQNIASRLLRTRRGRILCNNRAFLCHLSDVQLNTLFQQYQHHDGGGGDKTNTNINCNNLSLLQLLVERNMDKIEMFFYPSETKERMELFSHDPDDGVLREHFDTIHYYLFQVGSYLDMIRNVVHDSSSSSSINTHLSTSFESDCQCVISDNKENNDESSIDAQETLHSFLLDTSKTPVDYLGRIIAPHEKCFHWLNNINNRRDWLQTRERCMHYYTLLYLKYGGSLEWMHRGEKVRGDVKDIQTFVTLLPESLLENNIYNYIFKS